MVLARSEAGSPRFWLYVAIVVCILYGAAFAVLAPTFRPDDAMRAAHSDAFLFMDGRNYTDGFLVVLCIVSAVI